MEVAVLHEKVTLLRTLSFEIVNAMNHGLSELADKHYENFQMMLKEINGLNKDLKRHMDETKNEEAAKG